MDGSKYGNAKRGPGREISDLVADRTFWKKVAILMVVIGPLMQALKLVDGDEVPTTGFLYEAMERAKLAIKDKCKDS